MGNAGRVIGRCSMAIIGMLLASVVAAAAPDDIARLNKEAKALLRSDPQRAQQIAQQALQLAQARTDPAGEAGARINLGSIERQRGRYDQAVVEFERAVALTDDAKAQLPYADALTQLGVTLDMHQVKFLWLRGHDGHPENERADQLAVTALRGPELAIDRVYEAGK